MTAVHSGFRCFSEIMVLRFPNEVGESIKVPKSVLEKDTPWISEEPGDLL